MKLNFKFAALLLLTIVACGKTPMKSQSGGNDKNKESTKTGANGGDENGTQPGANSDALGATPSATLPGDEPTGVNGNSNTTTGNASGSGSSTGSVGSGSGSSTGSVGNGSGSSGTGIGTVNIPVLIPPPTPVPIQKKTIPFEFPIGTSGGYAYLQAIPIGSHFSNLAGRQVKISIQGGSWCAKFELVKSPYTIAIPNNGSIVVTLNSSSSTLSGLILGCQLFEYSSIPSMQPNWAQAVDRTGTLTIENP